VDGSGEYHTILIGNIFYEGDKIVSDENKEIFNKKIAKDLIFFQKEYSDKNGNFLNLEDYEEFNLIFNKNCPTNHINQIT